MNKKLSKKFYHVSANVNGLPINFEVVANTIAEAREFGKEISKTWADKLFEEGDLDICYESMASHVSVSHSLSVLSIDVKEDYLINGYGDCHDADIRNAINKAWCHYIYRNHFKYILGAYFERDKEEMANRYSEKCIWWQISEVSYEEACDAIDWKEILYEWVNYIADDADLQCVLDFIRPKYEE